MRKLDLSKIVYTLGIEPEDTPIEGNASAWDDGTDEAYWAELRERLENGDQWAWGLVRVSAAYPGLPAVGVDYLGGCSYRDAEDFKTGPYYANMCDAAKTALLAEIDLYRAALCGGEG